MAQVGAEATGSVAQDVQGRCVGLDSDHQHSAFLFNSTRVVQRQLYGV